MFLILKRTSLKYFLRSLFILHTKTELLVQSNEQNQSHICMHRYAKSWCVCYVSTRHNELNGYIKYVPLIIHSVIHDLLQTKADEMDVQLKKERQEWTSERNVLQQQNAELKVCVSLSCRSVIELAYITRNCMSVFIHIHSIYLLGCEWACIRIHTLLLNFLYFIRTCQSWYSCFVL